jgi:DNA topoisomerase-3
VQENYRKFQCLKCDFSLWKVTSGREWSPEEVAELLRNGKAGPLTGFRSRMGRPFVATLRLTPEYKLEFDFGQERTDASGEIEQPDFTGKEPVGDCPKCGARVFELDMAYSCEKALGPTKTCDFRSGKVILQRPIEREQMQKLLSTGKTDLLPRFISKKGRPFSAFLVKSPDGSVRFEFAPRAAKAPKKGAAVAVAEPATLPAPAAAERKKKAAVAAAKRPAAKAPTAKAAPQKTPAKQAKASGKAPPKKPKAAPRKKAAAKAR